jgi:hypothetical protein
MCLGGATAEVTPPEKTLAEAMKRDLGVDVSPEALRLFILMRWDRISLLAHVIHEKG